MLSELLCQDKPDARLKSKFLRESGVDVKEEWKHLALEYLTKEERPRAKPGALHRPVSYNVLCAFDGQLLVSIGLDLASYRAARSPGFAAASSSSSSASVGVGVMDAGRQLNLSVDQGSDGWSACMWLLYDAQLRCVVLF